MNPILTLTVARAEHEERQRRADAWRAAKAAPKLPSRWRPPLGRAVQRVGARIAGDATLAATREAATTRRHVATPGA